MSVNDSPEPEAAAPAAEETVTGPQEGTQAAQPDEGGAEDRQARRDGRWRERAQVAEVRAERLARREVLRLLGSVITDPEAALILGQVDVSDLMDDDGDVDTEAVQVLADELVQARPYLRVSGPVHHGDLGAKAVMPQRQSQSWGAVIGGR